MSDRLPGPPSTPPTRQQQHVIASTSLSRFMLQQHTSRSKLTVPSTPTTATGTSHQSWLPLDSLRGGRGNGEGEHSVAMSSITMSVPNLEKKLNDLDNKPCNGVIRLPESNRSVASTLTNRSGKPSMMRKIKRAFRKKGGKAKRKHSHTPTVDPTECDHGEEHGEDRDYGFDFYEPSDRVERIEDENEEESYEGDEEGDDDVDDDEGLRYPLEERATDDHSMELWNVALLPELILLQALARGFLDRTRLRAMRPRRRTTRRHPSTPKRRPRRRAGGVISRRPFEPRSPTRRHSEPPRPKVRFDLSSDDSEDDDILSQDDAWLDAHEPLVPVYNDYYEPVDRPTRVTASWDDSSIDSMVEFSFHSPDSPPLTRAKKFDPTPLNKLPDRKGTQSPKPPSITLRKVR